MNDMDDTLNFDPLVHRDEVGETTLILQDESLPELLLPPIPPRQPCEPVSSSRRFLLVLLRALSAWNV
jgi:hypothetical protein